MDLRGMRAGRWLHLGFCDEIVLQEEKYTSSNAILAASDIMARRGMSPFLLMRLEELSASSCVLRDTILSRHARSNDYDDI